MKTLVFMTIPNGFSKQATSNKIHTHTQWTNTGKNADFIYVNYHYTSYRMKCFILCKTFYSCKSTMSLSLKYQSLLL